MSENPSARDGALDALVAKMRELGSEHYSLRRFIPWQAVTLDKFGEDWPVGTVRREIVSTGATDTGDWCVATDNVRASKHNGATAEDDAKAIAALHNAWGELVNLAQAMLAARSAAHD